MRNRYNCDNCDYVDCKDLKEAIDNPEINLREFKDNGCFGHSYFDEKEAKERGFSLIEKEDIKNG